MIANAREAVLLSSIGSDGHGLLIYDGGPNKPVYAPCIIQKVFYA
jgi:hypothetical protein